MEWYFLCICIWFYLYSDWIYNIQSGRQAYKKKRYLCLNYGGGYLKKLKINLSGIAITAKRTVIENCFMNSDIRLCTPAIVLLFFIVFDSAYNSRIFNEIYAGPGDVFIQLLNINNNPLLYCGIMAFALVLLNDHPNLSQDMQFCLGRCGRKAWILGEMLGILLSGIIAGIFLWVVGIIANIQTIDWNHPMPTLQSIRALFVFCLFFLMIGNLLMLCKLLQVQLQGIAVVGMLLFVDRGIADLIPNTVVTLVGTESKISVVLSWYNRLSPAYRLSSLCTGNDWKSVAIYFGFMAIGLGGFLIFFADRKDI